MKNYRTTDPILFNNGGCRIKIKEKKMRNKKLISFCDARKFDRISYIKFTKSILILGL